MGGKTVTGISGGERKRTSMGIELVANPSVLILDGISKIGIFFLIISFKKEPTSGLDSFTAFLIVKILRNLAEKLQIIILYFYFSC